MNTNEPKPEPWIDRIWPALIIGGVWIWICWPMILGQQVVGFRDSAYLYYPLFQWIDAQWAAGEVPLWNPYCNFGIPVVADGTSSVFYPGKLVFFCRYLSYPARYGIYLAMHIPIAAAGAYWFARVLRANRLGATVAALSYAFGGSFLFQVTNVIYLVSGAWLPFALGCVWKMATTGQIKWSIAAGVACALMILGGDPQMVYHVGLIAVATTFAHWIWRIRRTANPGVRASTNSFVLLAAAGGRLLVMVLVTTVLAAIQILPTYSWSQLSERMHPDVPANIYQAWESIQRDGDLNLVQHALLDDPVGTGEHAYQFSQPPWSLLELVWPNFSGKPFPVHHRWASGLPGADRVWVPSLYAGWATILLGLMGIRLWGRRTNQVWLTYLFLFFMLGSFGWYGAVWLLAELYPELAQDLTFGPQVGGLYWAMNCLLPKYYAFRYPAKLFLIASLALSVLAGVNVHRLRSNWIAWIGLVYVGVTGCFIGGLDSLAESLVWELVPDSTFGPFDRPGAVADLHSGLFHSLVVGLATVALFAWFRRRSKFNQGGRWLAGLIVLVLAADLALSNRWLVPLVDVAVFENPHPLQNSLNRLRGDLQGSEPIRIYRSTFDYFEPRHWETESSANRLTEIIQWQRASLFPKHHLGQDAVLLGSFSSIWPTSSQQYLETFDWYRGGAVMTNGRPSPAVKYFHATLELGDDGQPFLKKFAPANAVGAALPLEWVFEYDPIGESAGTRHPIFLRNRNSRLSDCEVLVFENQRLVVQVTTNSSKVLAFLVPSVGGWQATIKDLNTGVEREGGLVNSDDWLLARRRGFANTPLLFFPDAGEYEVELTYQPTDFWVGAWISGASWIVLFLGLGLFLVAKVRK